ncbi:MAG: TlpA family protein disulfide reductase [Thermomonas sp.]|nr:MAG: TlpA family protein disulfide reductase [Thermomonas sp.]
MRNVLAGLMAVILCVGAMLPVQAAEPKTGDVPPALLGKDREGEVVDLAQHRGKVVVVTFWASWCGPCRKELPGLDALQKHAGDKILKVIAVNVKDSTEDYRLMMRQMKDYTISMTRDRSGEIAEGYGVKAYPNLWIIDPQGKVAAHHVGYGEDSLEALVNQINQVIVAEQQRQKAAAAASAAG